MPLSARFLSKFKTGRSAARPRTTDVAACICQYRTIKTLHYVLGAPTSVQDSHQTRVKAPDFLTKSTEPYVQSILSRDKAQLRQAMARRSDVSQRISIANTQSTDDRVAKTH